MANNLTAQRRPKVVVFINISTLSQQHTLPRAVPRDARTITPFSLIISSIFHPLLPLLHFLPLPVFLSLSYSLLTPYHVFFLPNLSAFLSTNLSSFLCPSHPLFFIPFFPTSLLPSLPLLVFLFLTPFLIPLLWFLPFQSQRRSTYSPLFFPPFVPPPPPPPLETRAKPQSRVKPDISQVPYHT